MSNGPGSDPAKEAMKSLTEEELKSWKGWVELESDPVGTQGLLPLMKEAACTAIAFGS